MKFEVGQEFEFEALYRDDTSRSNFGFTIIKRTPKMITAKFDSKDQQEQRFRVNEYRGEEFIVINHISGYELVTSRSIYAKYKKIEECGDKFMETQVCVICEKEFEGYGNNPAPYSNVGQCCDKCNMEYVVPARISELLN